MNQAECLLKFCRLIELDDESIKQGESLNGYHLVKNVNAKKLKIISAANINKLLDTFGDSLAFKIGDSPTLLDIKNGIYDDNASRSFDNISACADTLKIKFDIFIDKSKLINKYNLNLDQYGIIIYFFKKNLIRFLSASLIELDDKLYNKRCKPTTIFVSDLDGHHLCPMLKIIGCKNPSQIDEMMNGIEKKWIGWINKYYKNAFDNLSWINFKLNKLTPIHFFCIDSNIQDINIKAILSNHMFNLGLIYTANRTSYDGTIFESYFTGPEKITKLEFKSRPIDYEIEYNKNIMLNDNNLLLRFALWPHGDRGTDRLIIFQQVVSHEFENYGSTNNYQEFKRRLPQLLEASRWHHQIFIDGKIDKHFEQMQELTDYISNITKEISNTLDNMTKGLNDTILASIGIIMLTLLASFANDNLQEIILRSSLQLYAIYLILFQCIYRMGSLLHSYNILKEETDEKICFYAQIFGDKKISGFISPLIKRRNQFRFWFWITITIYIVAFIVIWTLSESDILQYIISPTTNTSV